MSEDLFFKLAKQHDINVDYEPRLGSNDAYILVDAPQGKVFSGSQLHCDGSLACCNAAGNIVWGKSYKALQELIAEGFEDCDDPDCDVCNGE